MGRLQQENLQEESGFNLCIILQVTLGETVHLTQTKQNKPTNAETKAHKELVTGTHKKI